MRYAHRSDCDDQCNGDWCECRCHLDERELREQRAAIEREQAKLRELYEALGRDQGEERPPADQQPREGTS